MNSHSINESIEGALTSMNLEEKIRLLSGADMFSLHGEPTIGLSPIRLSDGPTGVRGELVVGGRESCLLPNASLLAQTWNRDVLFQVGTLLADEAADQHTHVVLGPTINLHRSPLGGRLFEAFSEDPLLTGLLAAAYVQGIQSHGIAATPKHFLANESETERTTVDAVIDASALREVYLAPFEIVVQDAQPWALMAAYNRVNGIASTEHHPLINDVVKTEWGYDGLVMSDWYATSSAAESANGGLDLVMPGPNTPWSAGLAAAVQSGKVAESVIDDHVRRLLRLAHRVGAFAVQRSWPASTSAPDSIERRAQLRTLAASGMVVLKNHDQLLPLSMDGTEKIALIGRHVRDTIIQGGGSAQVRPPHVVTVEDGMTAALGVDRVSVVDGVETRTVLPTVSPRRVRDPETGEPGIRVRVFDANGTLLETRHLDVAELEDNQTGWLGQAECIELSATIEIPHAMDVQLGVRGPGSWHIVAPGLEERVTIPYHEGPGGGFFRPRSHATTIHISPGATITATTRRAELPRILGLVVSEAARSSCTAIADAVAAAQDSDVAVVVVGFTPDQETEGQDKTSLALPGDQDALVAAIAASARRTVVVLNAATPVLMPWLDQVDAVVFAGLPGQEAGDAIAAALTGQVLPEGRLVTTFPAKDGHGPAWSTTPKSGRLAYTEGTRIGYRGWHCEETAPAFWFGHGLGYASWAYERASVTSCEGSRVDSVTAEIWNTGTHPGRETVQVYHKPLDAKHPIRLIGWAQADVHPGQNCVVDVTCDARMQRVWEEATGRWVPLGPGDIIIARGLGDVRITIPASSFNHQ